MTLPHPLTPWCSTRWPRCTMSRIDYCEPKSRPQCLCAHCWMSSATAHIASARSREGWAGRRRVCRDRSRRWWKWDWYAAKSRSGATQRSGKRSLYRIADPFLRLWFRVVAPNRAGPRRSASRDTSHILAQTPRRSRRGRRGEELCRMATATLHRVNAPLRSYGPFEPAQRYWKGGEPELDVVARSVDERSLLVGEAKWSVSRDVGSIKADHIPGPSSGSEVVPTRFLPGGLPTGSAKFHGHRCAHGAGGASISTHLLSLLACSKGVFITGANGQSRAAADLPVARGLRGRRGGSVGSCGGDAQGQWGGDSTGRLS